MEHEKIKYKTFIVDDVAYKTLYHTKYEKREKYELPNPKVLRSFLPGNILKVLVKEGDVIKKGTGLCVLEAMKTESVIRSTVSGTVAKIHVHKGSVVPNNALLMEFDLDEEVVTQSDID
ncbi:MAG TPA: acetyl-CoA carboxylase biotin carboxyl carrier protein subunit [Salinivirgaceae bacterium]|nr:acetyl-CoA carboxylase biotin carboxyl carrier protein subunit [Salinivirgaceae bacterium]HQA75751.1 acetyl-CoA carboxylase biotin carboxyl carrier protein subunit [Salinivirgaceae bacterium]